VTTPDQPDIDLPSAVLYDVFRDTATALSAEYVHRSDHAPTVAEGQQWWDKALRLRDTAAAADPDDRDALLAAIHEWRIETTFLRDD